MTGEKQDGERQIGRTIISVGGADRRGFLQGLVTNDVDRLDDGLVYAALLTPQGKYLADFFLVPDGERILIDVATPLAADLFKRLRMYKLRADVALEEAADLAVFRGLGTPPEGAWPDPRDASLGWRRYGPAEASGHRAGVDWDALRVAACVPESGVELVPGETFILEAGFDRLGGVDFRKGCYVGQEVTARMRHKTQLRKGLATVTVEGDAAPGTEIRAEDGRPAGTLHTVAGGRAIAYLRFDRATGPMEAGAARVTWSPRTEDA